MRALLWNVLLALVWAFSFGEITLSSLLVGFALGYVVLWLSRGLLDTTYYCSRVPRLIEFSLFFIWKLIQANFKVAYDVLTPTHYMRPGIIALELDAKTDMEITMLANLITLTPGTLALEVSADRRHLYIHSMYITDPEADKQEIKHGFERRLLELLR